MTQMVKAIAAAKPDPETGANIAINDGAKVEQMIARNRALYDRIRSAGGILYPVSALPMSRND